MGIIRIITKMTLLQGNNFTVDSYKMAFVYKIRLQDTIEGNKAYSYTHNKTRKEKLFAI
ncbi:hypothetical protein EHE19_012620 [Ruminiclostridium herbifermentans]|uniref:Uncharacterized protein n=1 Tax=Ruminiclostridium herbifermentans TaxID=2488810 RepID=A0A7H1VK41_9FIRM|nr:hypothetical protein EHE19_012620 [Ruminiclostridium herbifermentans]